MADNSIPKEYLEQFVLAGKSHFVAHCTITDNKLHFFVRKRRNSNTYNVYIWCAKGWLKVGLYDKDAKILQVYTTNEKFRAAMRAVFKFAHAPHWLIIYHVNRCPRCGRKVEKSIFGFGEKCWRHIAQQISMEE